MPMSRKFCRSCAQDTWHNPTGKKGNEDRCVYCGHPLPKTSNEGKRMAADYIMRRQVAKLRLV